MGKHQTAGPRILGFGGNWGWALLGWLQHGNGDGASVGELIGHLMISNINHQGAQQKYEGKTYIGKKTMWPLNTISEWEFSK